MEGEQRDTADGAEARSPSQLGKEGPPTPRSESALEPRVEEGHPQPALDWYEQDQLEREAEKATVGIMDAIFLRAAERILTMEAERCEAALMRERAAEAAMRRIHDPIVIIDDDDDAPPGIDAEREEAEQAGALDCASVEESRRAEDELEHYLLNGSDDEPMELGVCPARCSPTLPEACALPADPWPLEEVIEVPALIAAHVDPPRPQRVWPYEDENWDSDAEMVEPQVRGEQRNVPLEQWRGEAPPRMSRTQRRRARRYNPNRQPTVDDYVSRRPSPPLEEHPGAPCGRERPATPPRPREERPRQREQRQREDDRAQAGTAPPVRVSGVMFGGLRPIPTDPAVDPPPYHCYNCWQHGHDRTQCPRPKVRVYCDNCGRHGVDLRDCPRCSEAHRRFVRANFANERSMAEEM